jgi:DNA-binding NarL/FixJ family response regulator
MGHSVLIADDHPILLSGLKALIDADPDFNVVATAADGATALEKVRQIEPDVAVLDLNMPLRTGLDVLTQITASGLDTSVVVLAATASDDDMHRLVTAGAKGLVLKESAPQLLIACLRAVAAGQVWFSEEVPAIVSRQGEQKRLWRERFESLTEREIEVVRLANAGASNKEIAYALQLVEGTVKVHLNNIFRKLHVSTRAELLSRTKGQLMPMAGHSV